MQVEPIGTIHFARQHDMWQHKGLFPKHFAGWVLPAAIKHLE